jgi:hypothetical protein
MLPCSKEHLEKPPRSVKARAVPIAGVGFSGGKYRRALWSLLGVSPWLAFAAFERIQTAYASHSSQFEAAPAK